MSMASIQPPRIWFSKSPATGFSYTLAEDIAVTGTSTGIGRAFVELLLEKGEIVIATARRPSTLDDLVQRHASDRLLVLPLDITKQEPLFDASGVAAKWKEEREQTIKDEAGVF